MQQLVMLALQILMPVIAVGLVGLIWKHIGAEGMKKIESELSAKKEYVLIAVRLIEQAYTDLHGEDKLNAAIKWVTARLNEKGIGFTEEELKGLIESAVRQMKDEFGSEWANAKERETTTGVRINGVTVNGPDVTELTPAIMKELVDKLKLTQYNR